MGKISETTENSNRKEPRIPECIVETITNGIVPSNGVISDKQILAPNAEINNSFIYFKALLQLPGHKALFQSTITAFWSQYVVTRKL